MKNELEIKMLPEEGLITLDELALYLQTDTYTLRKHLTEAEIPLFRFHRGKYLLSLRAISNFLCFSTEMQELILNPSEND